MGIFREHGFRGTSAQMLVETLGVNRFGLDAEFGNKQGLYEAALERYDIDVIGGNFGPLEASGAGLQEIRASLEFYASASKGLTSGRGCMQWNTAGEFGPVDPGGAEFVQRYFKHLSRAFYTALGNAHRRGELRSSATPREDADLFTYVVLGLFGMIRAKAPHTFKGNAAKVAIEHLEKLQPEQTM